MNYLTQDYETFYGTGFSLRSINTVEYVHDPRFKLHGCGFKLNDGETVYLNTPEAIHDYLQTVPRPVTLICHNTKFDGYINHAVFGWYPDVYADTQAMSRGVFPGQSASLDALAKRLWPDDMTMRKGKELLNTMNKRELTSEESAELGGYCKQDINLTYAAFLTMKPFYPDDELALIDLTTRMCVEPRFVLDTQLLMQTQADLSAKREAAIAASGHPESLFASNPKFARLIQKLGLEVPKKISPSTGLETDALGKSDLELQELMRSHPEHQTIWDARLATKSTGEITRCKRFLDTGKLTGNKMPVPLEYYSAHTGRYGGGWKLNLQNLKRGSNLRRALTAPEGHLVYVADSSNIEARTLAWEAGHLVLLEQFRNHEDVYANMAGHIYKRPINKHDDPVERFVGKTATLGLGYGMGAPKFRDTLAIGAMGPPINFSFPEAQNIVNTYRTINTPITRYWTKAEAMLFKMLHKDCDVEWGPLRVLHNCILLPNGMALRYHGLTAHEDPHTDRVSFEYYTGKYMTNIYGGKLVENITQALARIVLFEQMLQIDAYARAHDGRVVLNVHDEIIVIAPDFGARKTGDGWTNADKADAFFAGMLDILRKPPSWCSDLPLDAEGGYDTCYSK